MRSWMTVVLIALSLFLWFVLVMKLVGDHPPTWDLGATPYVPAEQYYSTRPTPSEAKPPRQIPPQDTGQGGKR